MGDGFMDLHPDDDDLHPQWHDQLQPGGKLVHSQ